VRPSSAPADLAGATLVEAEAPAGGATPSGPVDAAKERVAETAGAAGAAMTSAFEAAAAAKDAAAARAMQTGTAISSTVTQAASQAAGATSAAAGQIAGGATQLAGSVAEGAGSAKTTALAKVEQGTARARLLLLQKPALLLGGAFALGILIARLV
jgi:hypothetical protein